MPRNAKPTRTASLENQGKLRNLVSHVEYKEKKVEKGDRAKIKYCIMRKRKHN